MIKLDVDDWCDNCNEFSPNVEIHEETYYSFARCRNVVITCEHRERCDGIRVYLGNVNDNNSKFK